MGDREVSRGDRRWEIAKFRVEMEESIAIERQITEQSEAAIDKLPSTSCHRQAQAAESRASMSVRTSIRVRIVGYLPVNVF